MPNNKSREEKGISRRRLFFLAGWGSFLAFIGGSAVSLFKYMFPNVLYESPTRFKIGYPGDYIMGINEKWMKEGHFWVIKNERGIYVLIAICRHLGCTPIWHPNENLFKCPCHGSIYDIYGNVLAGPAPKTLWRAGITIDPIDGQMVIDTAVRQDFEPESTPKGLYVEEASREVEPFFIKA